MNNRTLSILILLVIFSVLSGAYYYYFGRTADVSLIIEGRGSVSITLDSEFGKTYQADCDTSCTFPWIPAVNYTLSAKRDGYVSFTDDFKIERGEKKQIKIALEKEVTLTEKKKTKTDTIATLKLARDIQDTLETNTGGITLGYRANGLYYALPNTSPQPSPFGGEGDALWSIFLKTDGKRARELFIIPNGKLDTNSISIYDGYIALVRWEKVSFYSLINGEEKVFDFPGNILSIKDTLDDDTKIITSPEWVFMYSVSDKTSRKNPLYDDIIQLSSGEIVALVKKTSKEKFSILSIDDTANDYVFLVGQDTRERKTLLKTPKNGQFLRYKNHEILFVSQTWEVFVVENVK